MTPDKKAHISYLYWYMVLNLHPLIRWNESGRPKAYLLCCCAYTLWYSKAFVLLFLGKAW